MKKKGFTLIELLVVISIIALLLSILIPALTKVKKQAQFVVCGSNIKQMVIAEVMYTVENDGYFSNGMICLSQPYGDANPAIADRDSSDDDCRWHDEKYNNDNRYDLWGQIWPYLEKQEIALCPTFKSLAKAEGSGHTGTHNSDIPVKPQYSYSQNIWLGNPSEYYGGIWPWASEYEAPRLSNVNCPSEVFMFAEENLWITGNGDLQLEEIPLYWSRASINDNGLFSIWENGETNIDCFATYHKISWASPEKKMAGVSNAAFADGHLETVLNYADTSDYKTYLSEPRNCIKLSDPKGWYRTIYPTGP